MIKRIMTLLMFAAAVVMPAAFAAQVTPMIVELDETGSGATTRIQVVNDEDGELPVEARVFRGEVSETGELSLVPADEDFLVFPPQAVIKPNSQQNFRVQYLASAPLEKSEVYYLSVREIPLPLENGQSKLQLVMNFNVLVNVVPEGAQAQPVVDYVRPVERDGETGLEVRVLNQGNRYFAAGRTPWQISGQDNDGNNVRMSFGPMEIGSRIGYGLVAAGKARVFFVPTETLLSGDNIKVDLN